MIQLGLTAPGFDQNHLHAHRHCMRNRGELQTSAHCGCFYCFAIFPSVDIVEWIDDDQTAMCPKCGIDSVIGSSSGFPITSEFLLRMHDYYF